jgi:hypothetical protein
MMKTKIKIVRREFFHDGCYYEVYDTYHGFTGMPSTWPFLTKWVRDKVGMTANEMLNYMRSYLTTVGKVKVIVKYVRQW